MNDIQRYTQERFKGAPWYNYIDKGTVVVGGVGGIGSNLVYILSKQGLNLSVVDDDTVEPHNIGGQMYNLDNVGMFKVHALNNFCKNTNSNTLRPFNERFDVDKYYKYRGYGINEFIVYVAAFDNMRARKDIFTAFLKDRDSSSTPSKVLFVDGRLSAEYFKYFVFNGSEENKQKDYYNNHLKDDSEYKEENCTFKQTTSVAMMLASKMAVAITNFIVNNVTKEGGIKVIPYIEEYSAQVGQITFKTNVE